MILERLELRDFRNFEQLRIQLKPRLNFFFGNNGQGKTNLVEAVHYMSRGRSFRATDAHNVVRQGSAAARIRGVFTNCGRSFDTTVSFLGDKKTAKINDKRASSEDLMREFPSILFSPESLGAIKEGPEQRRLLIDEILLNHDPRKGHLLREYSRSLRARNQLLKTIAKGTSHRDQHMATLESLNKIYFLLSTHLTSARIEALHALRSPFQDAAQAILESQAGDTSVDYVVSGRSALQWSDTEIFDALHERAQQLAARELSFGASLVGPNKHDIKILFAGNDSRFFCSQGQQRALILALKIAQIVYHQQVHQTYPVLLLDDVLSELDEKKRVNLMKFLEGISAQILVTSTDFAWSDRFSTEQNSIFDVLNGRVEERSP
jgi:DNA replication and repair protein RecF